MKSRLSETKENVAKISKMDSELKSRLSAPEFESLIDETVSNKLESCQTTCRDLSNELDKMGESVESAMKLTDGFSKILSGTQQELQGFADLEEPIKFDSFEAVDEFHQSLNVSFDQFRSLIIKHEP